MIAQGYVPSPMILYCPYVPSVLFTKMEQAIKEIEEENKFLDGKYGPERRKDAINDKLKLIGGNLELYEAQQKLYEKYLGSQQ